MTPNTKNHEKCWNCNADLVFEDQTEVGGPPDYWMCLSCGEEQEMFNGESK